MTEVSLDQALQLVVLYAEQGEPRFERAPVARPTVPREAKPFALAVRCVELVSELRGPAPQPAAKALVSLVRN